MQISRTAIKVVKMFKKIADSNAVLIENL